MSQSKVMSTSQKRVYEWKALPWREIERKVFKLQKRIYQASRRGDTKAVHSLQRLMLHSWFAILLAVRKVTQDNRGKRSAGVDGKANLSTHERMTLAQKIQQEPLSGKAPPVRRTWIPKPGSQEKRPLGIPTIEQRARQTLVKLALEPEWEACFEPNSYGFRPGRSAHDAVAAIFSFINQQPKYVLDADIEKCFDRINQKVLLEKLNTFPKLRQTIKVWLEAGVLEKEQFFPSEEGVPQGGTLSPLLMNIALHGLENFIRENSQQRQKGKKPAVIRYADDLVILHPELQEIQRAKEALEGWLEELGLRLKSKKTRITHTLHSHEGNVGFNFLGFRFRNKMVGKRHQKKTTRGLPKRFVTWITPSREAQKRHQQRLAEELSGLKAQMQAIVILKLNKIIRGWSNYYRTVVSSEVLAKMDNLLYQKLRRWAYRRHPNKNKWWIMKKYWRPRGNARWRFAEAKGGYCLMRHNDVKIRRHIKVQSARSPFDGDWAYWASRTGKHPELTTTVARLLKKQEGKCRRCGLFFKKEDVVEKDHIIPRSQGGKNEYENLQLLHGHCHDQKTAEDQQNHRQR